MKAMYLKIVLVLASLVIMDSSNAKALQRQPLITLPDGQVAVPLYKSRCGHYFTLGTSAEFGTYTQYNRKPYSEMGWFDSELAQITLLTEFSVRYYKARLKSYHSDINRLQGLLDNVDISLEQLTTGKKTEVEKDPEQINRLNQYRVSIEQQMGQSTQKAYSDIARQLSVQGGWQLYSECNVWWEYEIDHRADLEKRYPRLMTTETKGDD